MKENFNLTYLKELSDGDKAFEKKLLDILKTELPEEMKDRNYKKSLSFLLKKHLLLIMESNILGTEPFTFTPIR